MGPIGPQDKNITPKNDQTHDNIWHALIIETKTEQEYWSLREDKVTIRT